MTNPGSPPTLTPSKLAEDQMRLYGLRMQDLYECFRAGNSAPGKRGRWHWGTVRGKNVAILVVESNRRGEGLFVLDVRDRPNV